MMKLNRYMGNVCTVTSPYNIHGKLQAIISLFLSGEHGWQHNNQVLVGLLAQLVKHCTGIAEAMGSNPVQA